MPDGRDFLPFEICGRLRPGVYELPGNVSSQYFSGLMFALPLLKGDSEIRVKGKMESVGYIALTQQMLSDFGVRVEETEYGFRVSRKSEIPGYGYLCGGRLFPGCVLAGGCCLRF